MDWPNARLYACLVCAVSACALTGCEDKYRYACQDPANWGTPTCESPLCDADSTCTKDLIGAETYDIWKQRSKADPTGAAGISGIPESAGGVSHSSGIRMRDGWCSDLRNLWVGTCDATGGQAGSERYSLDRDVKTNADINRVNSGNPDSSGTGQGQK